MSQNKMGTKSMFPLIMGMSLPAIFSMLVQSLYNIVDSVFVSRIGENALTAVSLAYPMQMLIISFAVGTGIGVNSLISRRLGEKRFDEANSAATHGIVLAFVTWIIFAICGILFSNWFITFFADKGENAKEIIKMGTDYLFVVQVFSIFSFIVLDIEKTIQSTGNMIYPMISQLIGAIVNTILDPIMIFSMNLGVLGAAIATVIAQGCSFIFILIIIKTKEFPIKITVKNFKFASKTVKDIYAVAMPSIVMQSITSVLIFGLNKILYAFSSTAVAVLGVYFKLQSFVFMPVFGLNQGLMPIMGYNFGACNRKRLMSAYRIGCMIGVVIMAIGLLIFTVFPKQLMEIFDASDDMMTIGVSAMRILSLNFIPAALGIISATTFQATGKGIYSLVVSVLRQLVIILPVAYIFAKIFNSAVAVWWAFPIAESIALIVSIALMIKLYKTEIIKLDQRKELLQ